MYDAYSKLQDAEAATSQEKSTVLAAALTQQIEAARVIAETGAVAKLGDFRTSLHATLDTVVSPVARVAGLKAASERIDALLTADVCAAWAFWEALALIADANDPRARSASWLEGAKAIVHAAKDDAALQAAEAETLRLVQESIFAAQVRQISALAQAQLALNGDARARCRGGRLNCATVYFADSRNFGAIPVAILKQRPGQVRNEYGIRRQRALANKESLLIKAASAQLTAYVEDGIDPALVSRLFANAVLIGATVQ